MSQVAQNPIDFYQPQPGETHIESMCRNYDHYVVEQTPAMVQKIYHKLTSLMTHAITLNIPVSNLTSVKREHGNKSAFIKTLSLLSYGILAHIVKASNSKILLLKQFDKGNVYYHSILKAGDTICANPQAVASKNSEERTFYRLKAITDKLLKIDPVNTIAIMNEVSPIVITAGKTESIRSRIMKYISTYFLVKGEHYNAALAMSKHANKKTRNDETSKIFQEIVPHDKSPQVLSLAQIQAGVSVPAPEISFEQLGVARRIYPMFDAFYTFPLYFKELTKAYVDNGHIDEAVSFAKECFVNRPALLTDAAHRIFTEKALKNIFKSSELRDNPERRAKIFEGFSQQEAREMITQIIPEHYSN